MVDKDGYRSNVAMVISNGRGQVFWAKRVGQRAWQFPQGGVDYKESVEQALYRELYEEIGLTAEDVSVVGRTRRWLRYKIPPNLRRNKGSDVCIGQKQKWFIVKFTGNDSEINLKTCRNINRV